MIKAKRGSEKFFQTHKKDYQANSQANTANQAKSSKDELSTEELHTRHRAQGSECPGPAHRTSHLSESCKRGIFYATRALPPQARRRTLTGGGPSGWPQARSIGVLRTPTEGSWAYVAKRRVIQAGQKVQKVNMDAKPVARAKPEPEPVWSEVAHLRQHHAQTKL